MPIGASVPSMLVMLVRRGHGAWVQLHQAHADPLQAVVSNACEESSEALRAMYDELCRVRSFGGRRLEEGIDAERLGASLRNRVFD